MICKLDNQYSHGIRQRRQTRRTEQWSGNSNPTVGNVYFFVDKFAFAVKVECNYFSESDWKWKDLVKVLNQTAPSLYMASSC